MANCLPKTAWKWNNLDGGVPSTLLWCATDDARNLLASSNQYFWIRFCKGRKVKRKAIEKDTQKRWQNADKCEFFSGLYFNSEAKEIVRIDVIQARNYALLGRNQSVLNSFHQRRFFFFALQYISKLILFETPPQALRHLCWNFGLTKVFSAMKGILCDAANVEMISPR